MYRRIGLVLASAAASTAGTCQTLYDIAYADGIVIGRVASEPSATIRLPTMRTPEGPVTGESTYGLYEVEVQQSIKGSASGKMVVVALQGDIAGVGDAPSIVKKGAEEWWWAGNERAGVSLPRGAGWYYCFRRWPFRAWSAI